VNFFVILEIFESIMVQLMHVILVIKNVVVLKGLGFVKKVFKKKGGGAKVICYFHNLKVIK
jgi:uncharacterized protein YqhQ